MLDLFTLYGIFVLGVLFEILVLTVLILVLLLVFLVLFTWILVVDFIVFSLSLSLLSRFILPVVELLSVINKSVFMLSNIYYDTIYKEIRTYHKKIDIKHI